MKSIHNNDVEMYINRVYSIHISSTCYIRLTNSFLGYPFIHTPRHLESKNFDTPYVLFFNQLGFRIGRLRECSYYHFCVQVTLTFVNKF